jgi:N4-gp56 family major capsid protein
MADLSPGIVVGTSNFDKMIQEMISKKLEDVLRSPLPHLLPGNYLPATFVKGSNSTMRFNHIPDLTATTNSNTVTKGTTPWLYEGTAPTDEALTFGYEEFTAYQAGRTIAMSDLAIAENPHDLVAIAIEKLARNAVETMDLYVATMLSAGANVMYANGKARDTLSNADILDGANLRKAVGWLKEQNIPTFPDGRYRAIVSPTTAYGLMNDTATGGWLDAQRYAGSERIFSGEIGQYAGVRFIESTNAVHVDAAYGTVGDGATTITDATGEADTELFTTSADHGLEANEKLYFSALTGGTGLSTNTIYFVKTVPTSKTFTLSATRGGSTQAFSTDVSACTIHPVCDVHNTVVFGPGAYAFGDWGTVQAYFTPAGGLTDPLRQVVKVGWKARFGAMIVGEGANATTVPEGRYIRIESGSNLF